jgi:hypothetical protein
VYWSGRCAAHPVPQIIYNVYNPPMPYPLLLFLSFPFATLISTVHIVSQIEAALVTIAANSSSNSPRRSRVASITNWMVAIYAGFQFIGQFIMLGFCTGQIKQVLHATDQLSAQLLDWAAAWTEGSPLPLARLLSLQPLLDQVRHHFLLFMDFQKAYAGVLFSHVWLTFLCLFPATYIQIRDIRRQLADLRSVRRNLDGSGQSPGFFKGVFAALFVRHNEYEVGSSASAGTENARARLVLLEAICKNM